MVFMTLHAIQVAYTNDVEETDEVQKMVVVSVYSLSRALRILYI